jgi:hypothetical protein
MGRESVVPSVTRILTDLTFMESRNWECFFIAALGRRDLKTGPLCNQTSGGEGMSNPSAETRKRMSASMKIACSKPDRKRRMVEAAHQPETKKRKSESLKVSARLTWRDSEVRRRRVEASRKASTRKLKSDAMLSAWSNVAYRKYILDAQRHSAPRSGRFKGVSKNGTGWQARIADDHLGTFKTELEAAKAYNDAVDKYWNGVGWKNPV